MLMKNRHTPPVRRSCFVAPRHFLLRTVRVLLIGAVLAAGLTGCALLGKGGGGSDLTLVWYGVARQGAFTDPTYASIEDNVTLATNEGVQLFVSVQPSAYLYVLHQKVSGEIAVLWPKENQNFNALLQDGRVQILPSPRHIYNMELARGTEAFYLIAAKEPIETIQQLTTEMRCLFVSAQSVAAGVPADQIRRSLPEDLKWALHWRDPGPVEVVDHRIPVGTTVSCVGSREAGSQQVITTSQGDTYPVTAERITGKNVVARVIRVRRIISR